MAGNCRSPVSAGNRHKPISSKYWWRWWEKKGTQIVYVRGNHDDFLDALVPFRFSNISIVKDYLLNSHGKRYLVTHGDIFDTITTHMRWLAMLGDIGYTFLLWLNKIYNKNREKHGKPYFSLSQHVKHRVKSAVSYISDFEKELVKLAKQASGRNYLWTYPSGSQCLVWQCSLPELRRLGGKHDCPGGGWTRWVECCYLQ